MFMRRELNNFKKHGFNVISIFIIALSFTIGMTSNAKGASGSFDRDSYLPSLSDTTDFDRAWISVTDSTANVTNTPDTIAVTINIKSGFNSTNFVLKETGGTTNVFTSSGLIQPIMYPIGTSSGYVEDFNTGSHGYPALGSSIVGLNLKELTLNSGGSAEMGISGELIVSAGNTMELLYNGSTLDTAIVEFNSGSFTFTPSILSAVTTTELTLPNVIVLLYDPDENLNPVAKDVIGFTENFSFAGLAPGTGSSRIQIEAIDQSTGSRRVDNIPLVATHIMMIENGNNTGLFIASGKIYNNNTPTSSSLKGNILTGQDTNSLSAYAGDIITLGDLTDGPGVKFRIIETNESGTLALIYNGTTTSTSYGVASLAYQANVNNPNFSGYGFSNLSISKVVAISEQTNAFGDPSNPSNLSQSKSNLVKLIDGNNYCLVAISEFKSTTSPPATGGIVGSIYGSTKVYVSAFQLVGAVSGDTIKISYLDELANGGVYGTTTGTFTYGTSTVTNPTPSLTPTVTVTEVPTPCSDDGAIVGTVIDSLTGKPISGATVSTDTGGYLATTDATKDWTMANMCPGTDTGTNTGGYSATTDAAGNYELFDIVLGNYVLTASAAGYTSSSQSVDVIPAMIVANFALIPVIPTPTLIPTPANGIIYGFVYDEDEMPMRSVSMTLTGPNNYSESSKTDEDGYYSFEELAAGDYTVRASKSGYLHAFEDVSLGEGESTEVDFDMEERERSIYGFVTDIYGDPIENVRITLKGLRTKFNAKTVSDRDGFFEVTDLDADKYVIKAKKKRYRPARKTVEIEEGESKEIEIEMNRIFKIFSKRH